MISFDEAIGLIDSNVNGLGIDTVHLEQAAGRVLLEPLRAPCDAPKRATAAMDGYAVHNASTKPGRPVRVVGQSIAGCGFEGIIEPNETVRIFTGAPMPDGSDRCIAQEHAERDGTTVTFAEGYGPGWHVRGPGSDFLEGDVLVPKGTRLGPRAMLAAAAADTASVTVSKQPRLALIGTGSELRKPGTAHDRTDAIPESVTYGVAAMAEEAGAVITDRVLGADDLPSLERLAGSALSNADIVVVTGGASVGERDYAKPMFAPHGLDLLFTKVAIKPGKPIWFGRAKGKWVLGLPGNPTSAMVTARLFLAPILARMQGQLDGGSSQWQKMPLAENLSAGGDRETFVRARLTDNGLVQLGDQGSGAQRALFQADWLIRRKAGADPCLAGDWCPALLF